ncbi:laminin subunit alpha-1 [Elysia marginata]|uniref:Laminin subunit alpha-1 n=1 Tax=Elysia marginata TaxID=1093978 RepID=A0AAV4J8Y9_9GAST|nr:laminin subunit alpha-1 [Elysia marginata]
MLREGENMVRQSHVSLTSSMTNQKENLKLFDEWIAKKQASGSTPAHSMASKHHAQLESLSGKVMSSDIYSRYLKNETERGLRELISATKRANRFLSEPSRQGSANIQLQSHRKKLQRFIPEMYDVLEEIGNLTGSDVNVTRPIKCTPAETFEGSGDDGEVDEDGAVMCASEVDDNTPMANSDGEKGVNDNDNKSNGGGAFGYFSWFGGSDNADEDDFTFEDSEPVVQPAKTLKISNIDRRKQDMTALNRDVKAYTAALMEQSQQLFKNAQPLNASLKSLQQNWEEIREDVNNIEKTLEAHKALKKELEEMAKDTMSVTSRIEQLENLPSLLQLSNMRRTAKRIERKYVAVYTGKKEPNDGWQADYYMLDFYGDDYYYDLDEDENDENNTKSFEKDLEQHDAAIVSYEDLYKKGRQIQDNHNDIQRLRNLATTSCGRVGKQLENVRTNLTSLRHKVFQARDMLSSMKLSISKRGDGHIAVPIKSTSKQDNEQTIMRLCIRPSSLDGPVLIVEGNDSASYKLSLDEGVLTVSVHDADWTDLNHITMDNSLTKDNWYTLHIQRVGIFFTVSLQQQDQEMESKRLRVNLDKLQSWRSEPTMAFLGGAPAHIHAVSGSWEGCVGDLTINGRAVSLFTLDSKGQGAILCDSHCSTRTEALSTIFNGDGFIHYSKPVGMNLMSVALTFSSYQQTTSLVSIVNNTEGFFLHIMLEKGFLKVQRSSEQKSVLYLSSDDDYGNGNSHKVKVEFKDSATHITVDETKDEFQVKSSKPDRETQSLEGISIGAFVSTDRQFHHNMPRPLIGCIRDVSVNEERLLLAQAKETYNVYRGHCVDAQKQISHACFKWSDESSSLMFEDLSQSNAASLWVSYNATGPLLRYIRQDDFTVDIIIQSDELVVTFDGDPSATLNKPQDFNAEDFFSVKVMDKPSE